MWRSNATRDQRVRDVTTKVEPGWPIEAALATGTLQVANRLTLWPPTGHLDFASRTNIDPIYFCNILVSSVMRLHILLSHSQRFTVLLWLHNWRYWKTQQPLMITKFQPLKKSISCTGEFISVLNAFDLSFWIIYLPFCHGISRHIRARFLWMKVRSNSSWSIFLLLKRNLRPVFVVP